MTKEEAIEAIKCNWPDSRYTILREALDMAISALRQMDGEPVWVVWPDGRIKSQWFIISSTFWIEMFQEWGGTLSKDYGKTWLAYRQKPEEETV